MAKNVDINQLFREFFHGPDERRVKDVGDVKDVLKRMDAIQDELLAALFQAGRREGLHVGFEKGFEYARKHFERLAAKQDAMEVAAKIRDVVLERKKRV